MAATTEDKRWDLARSLEPLHAASLALGLTPVYFSRPRDGEDPHVRTSRLALLYSALLCCALCASAGVYASARARDASSADSKTLVMEVAVAALLYATALGAVGSAALHPSRVARLLAALAAADHALAADVDALYRRARRVRLWRLSALALALAAFLAYDATRSAPAWPLATYPVVFGAVADAQYLDFVLMIRARFSALNRRLDRALTACAENARDVESTPPFTELELLSLCRVHDALCEGIGLVNTCYGVQILLEFTFLLVDTVSSVFYSFQIGISSFAHWLVLDTVKIVMLAVSCHRCTEEATNASSYVTRLLMEPVGKPLRRVLINFSQQLTHSQTRFCACSLFFLDCTLLSSMAYAIAAYLVILVQYKVPQDTMSTTTPSSTEPSLLLEGPA